MTAETSVKANLLRSLRLLLKPLVRLLMSQGIGHQEFSEAAKEVYVEIALREQLSRGMGKTNKSGVAVATGLTRKEVSAVISRALGEEPQKRTLSRPARVLSGWHSDPAFTGPYGFPLEIAYEDKAGQPSFVDLVKTYSGDQSPKQILEELLRAGAVVETEENTYKPARRDFEPDRLSPELIGRFGDVTFDLLTTLSSNVRKEGVGQGIFDRRVLSDNKLSRDELVRFEAYLKDRGQMFLEEVDNWLSNAVTYKEPQSEGVFDSGLTMIHFTTYNPEEKFTLSELLEQLSSSTSRNNEGDLED